MNAWLIGLGLALLCVVHAEETTGIDHDRIQGQWHILAVASDCEKIMKHKDEMEVLRATLTKEDEGSLRVTSALPLPDGCKKIEMVFKKGEDGKLVHKCKWGEKIIDEAETDYKTYGIVSVTLKKEGKEPHTLVTLYGKEAKVTPEMLEKFMEKVKAKGLKEEDVKVFPNEKVACAETE